MPTGTGIDGQVSYAIETTWGVSVATTRFIPLLSSTLKKDINPVESAGIIAGAQVLRSTQWAQGNATVGGDIQHELYTESMGMLLRAAFGTVSTSGTAAPWTHVFFPASPTVSLTIQTGRPAIYGSVIPFTYEGSVISKWSLGAKAGENLTWGMTVVAEEETMGTALVAAAYNGTLIPWSFKFANLTIDGTAVPVKEFTVDGDNQLAEDRHFIGGTTISQPLRQDYAAYTGQLTCEWGNPSGMGTLNYLRFLGGTESTLVLVATAGAGTALRAATLAANVRYDGQTPAVSGRGIVDHPIPFKCVAPGTLDSNAITFTYRSGDATA